MNYILAFLNSFSQVFLVENKFFGLLILISLFVIQPRIGIFATLGSAVSLIFALLIGVEKSLIYAGLIGFNSVLIGVACAILLPKNEMAALITIIASIGAVLFQLIALKYNISVFTLPFALAAIIIFLLTR
jgi:urea transporter